MRRRLTEKVDIYRPQFEASEGTHPAITLIQDFQPPELQEHKSLLLSTQFLAPCYGSPSRLTIGWMGYF